MFVKEAEITHLWRLHSHVINVPIEKQFKIENDRW